MNRYLRYESQDFPVQVVRESPAGVGDFRWHGVPVVFYL